MQKSQLFRELCAEAQACTICPNLADKVAVLSELNGRLDPKVMFIGEAPGRVGADRTRRPFDAKQLRKVWKAERRAQLSEKESLEQVSG